MQNFGCIFCLRPDFSSKIILPSQIIHISQLYTVKKNLNCPIDTIIFLVLKGVPIRVNTYNIKIEVK